MKFDFSIVVKFGDLIKLVPENIAIPDSVKIDVKVHLEDSSFNEVGNTFEDEWCTTHSDRAIDNVEHLEQVFDFFHEFKDLPLTAHDTRFDLLMCLNQFWRCKIVYLLVLLSAHRWNIKYSFILYFLSVFKYLELVWFTMWQSGPSVLLVWALVIETTTYYKQVLRKVARKFVREFWKSLSFSVFYSEVIIDVEQSLPGPFACLFVSVHIFEITSTKFRWHMEKFMFFDSFLIIYHITVGAFSDHFHPSAIWFVFLFRWMTTTTSEWVVFDFNSLFRFFESILDFLSTENITIEMLAENLCSLVINGVFRIDWDDIIDAHLKKRFSYSFRIARVDKNDLR